jgi:hypothetical protein
MPLYAQGHSVAKYLITRGGKRSFIRFIEDGMRDDNWPRAAQEHYGFRHLTDMQNQWLAWVKAGRPMPEGDAAVKLAASPILLGPADGQPEIVRGQNPERTPPSGPGVRVQAVARNHKTSPVGPPAEELSAVSPSLPSSVIFQWRAPGSFHAQRPSVVHP